MPNPLADLEKREAFLSVPRLAILMTNRKASAPIGIPVWYEWNGKTVEMFAGAGTLKTKNGFVSNGGRVLNFVSTSDDFLKCRDETINLIKKLNWKNGYFRRDIGYKVIKT